MDAQIKSQWIEALRSGKYKQGTGYLRPNENRFCCVGVLLDVIAPDEWDGGAHRHGQIAEMPMDLRETVGLSPPQVDSLYQMNDEYGKTFSEIADYIEANL